MHTYKATVDNVIDGDTLDVSIDLGFKLTTRQRVRLAGIDTPERGKPGFAEAGNAVRELVLGKTVTLTTTKVSKWGYYLASVTTPDGADLSSTIIALGLGKAYDGGTKEAA